MLRALDLVAGLLLLWLGCAAALQVQIIPSQGEISLGDSKFFICQVVGDAKDIDWFNPEGEKILPDNPNIFVSQSDESTSTLTIYHATGDNAGNYRCVAKAAGQEAEATVKVKIFQKITFKNAPSPQEFNEGDDADLVCDVVSSPSADIMWKYKFNVIKSDKDVRFKVLDNGHLLIRGIKKADEGMYSCEARVISRGELDFRMIKVVINVLPSIRARQEEVNSTADAGSTALLACDADGFPEPTVTWAHNNVVLESGDKYSLNEDGSELLIRNVKKLDEGEYTCIARNKAGEKAEEVSLKVFVPPRITYLNNQSASEFDDQVTLTCEASGDPTPSILWSFDNRVFTEGEQASWTRPDKYESLDRNIVVRSHARVSSLTLKNVQFTYAGQYLCTASNSIGEDSQSMSLEVRYAPKILGQVTVYTWEGNPANISCEVEAHPSAEMLWFRDGIQLPNANSSNVKIYNTPSISYLEINPDSQNDFGSYNCTATNILGTESKEFLLIQAEVPSSPEIQQVEPFSSTAVVEFDEPDSSGGVTILKYKVQWRLPGREWSGREYDASDELTKVTITGLKPETSYEVRMSAINGKGEGESSEAMAFRTEPVQGEPSAPKLEAKVHNKGNALKVNWFKQDDGGSPIKHYLVRYKAKHTSDWKPEIRLPHGSDYVVLSGLDWNTEYEVHVVAENQRGKSQPGVLSFRTANEPTTVPDSLGGGSGLGTGAIVGILIVVFFVLLVSVDVTCYFLNKCGLLMCLAVNMCGKSGPGAKGKDIEEGKAAFTKDESKEPIVEVRTEEENTPSQEGGGATEPNETTPLTDPEPAALDSSCTPAVTLNPSNNASNSVAESFSTAQSSPVSECTTLTSASPTKAAPAPQNSPGSAPRQPEVGALVDLSEAPPPQSTPVPPISDPSPLPSVANSSAVEGGTTEEPEPQCTSNDGKAVKEDGVKPDGEVKNGTAEANNATAEVKTVPSEAPQANGNESKA